VGNDRCQSRTGVSVTRTSPQAIRARRARRRRALPTPASKARARGAQRHGATHRAARRRAWFRSEARRHTAWLLRNSSRLPASDGSLTLIFNLAADASPELPQRGSNHTVTAPGLGVNLDRRRGEEGRRVLLLRAPLARERASSSDRQRRGCGTRASRHDDVHPSYRRAVGLPA
jgi:hypothetical protein